MRKTLEKTSVVFFYCGFTNGSKVYTVMVCFSTIDIIHRTIYNLHTK